MGYLILMNALLKQHSNLTDIYICEMFDVAALPSSFVNCFKM